MKPDQERVRALLTETITLLCRTGLRYEKQLKVEGLLGVTLDSSEVFIVHLNEIIVEESGQQNEPSSDPVPVSCERSNQSPQRHSKKRKRLLRASGTEPESDSSVEGNSPNPKSDNSRVEPESDERKNISEPCISNTDGSSVCVKLEPKDDDVIPVEEDGSLVDCSHSVDLSFTCPPVFKKTRIDDVDCNRMPVESSQDFGVGAKAEFLDVGSNFDSLNYSKFGQPNCPVQLLCNTGIGENFWHDAQQLADNAAGDIQRFGSNNIPDMSWASVQLQGTNSASRPLFCSGSRTISSALQHKATASLFPVIPRRTRYSSEKTYVCQFALCGKKFYQSYNLYRHQREKHGNVYS